MRSNVLVLILLYTEIIPIQAPAAPAKRKTKGTKDDSSARTNTMLDAFVGRAQSPERPDEDIVMNEDGTMSLDPQ